MKPWQPPYQHIALWPERVRDRSKATLCSEPTIIHNSYLHSGLQKALCIYLSLHLTYRKHDKIRCKVDFQHVTDHAFTLLPLEISDIQYVSMHEWRRTYARGRQASHSYNPFVVVTTLTSGSLFAENYSKIKCDFRSSQPTTISKVFF